MKLIAITNRPSAIPFLLGSRNVPFVAFFLFVALSISCLGKSNSRKSVDEIVIEGKAIVEEIVKFEKRTNSLPKSLSEMKLQSSRWVYIRLDNESYMISFETGGRGDRVEFRYGEKHHGDGETGWFHYEGEKLIRLK